MDITITKTEQEKTIVKKYFVINRVQVERWELYDVLQGLEGCYGVRRIAIHNDTIADLLVELDVARQKAAGSYYEGRNFDEFYNMIEDRLLEEE